jgi:hypothetical protein
LARANKTLEDDIAELKVSLKKAGGELTIVKHLSDNQVKLKTENVKKLKQMDKEIEYAQKLNVTLKNNYTKIKQEKDNLLKAILNIIEKTTNDKNIINEYKRIYNVFNNEYFLANLKPVDEQDVENMLGRIHNLKKQIDNKEFELNNLNKLLNNDNKKTKK